MSIVSDAPSTVLTARERGEIERRVIAEGLLCHCGREATSAQIEDWLDEFRRDPEPFAWSCPEWHYCDECKGAGAPKGAGPGQVCPICSGEGEVSA